MANINVTAHRRALAGYLLRYDLRADRDVSVPGHFCELAKETLIQLVQDNLNELGGVKFELRLSINFHSDLDLGRQILSHFNSKQIPLLQANNVAPAVDAAIQGVLEKIDQFQELGSNWVVDTVFGATLHVARYAPLRGSSYFPLPRVLQSKKAVINVQNDDQYCFIWSLLAAKNRFESHPERVSKYRGQFPGFDISGLDFPVSLTDIEEFSAKNNMSIAVYGFKKRVYPLLLPQQVQPNHVNLLYLEQGDRSHYCWIKDLHKLLFDENCHQNRKLYCQSCLKIFYLEGKWVEHQLHCGSQRQDIRMSESDILEFTDYEKVLRKPYCVYADFECLLRPTATCNPKPSCSYTMQTHEHIPSGFAMVDAINCCDKTATQYGDVYVQRGTEGCVESFLERLLSLSNAYIENHQRFRNDMTMTEDDKESFNTATDCHICQKAMAGEKVRDHCHVCRKFRGAADSECNLQYRTGYDIPVLLHNLRRYDGHPILQQLGSFAQTKGFKIDCVPKGTEDYLTFSITKQIDKHRKLRIRFVDTFQFLPASLDSLVSNLKDGPDSVKNFPAMVKKFGRKTPILLRKGVFPYEYMDDEKRLDEKQLPDKASFYSALSDSHISDAEYAYAQEVWEHFEIKSLGQYQDLYVVTDTLLLCDVFESFRYHCLKDYRLDPCQFITLPSLAWSACLLMTGEKLELLTDREMYEFFEKGIRGGIAIITHRYSRANHPGMPDFDPEKPHVYIIYLDANNLYGWAMTQLLPVRGFRWLTSEEIDLLDIRNLSDESEIGYVLEVDLEYPEEYHDDHNCYPLAPEKVSIPYQMMSPFCQFLHQHLDVSGEAAEKLIPNLYDKENYIVHYRILKLYLQLGMRIKHIHRVIRFEQKAWIKPYIDYNTEKRKEAKTEFESNLRKLANNAIYGKSCENTRYYKDVRLVTNQEAFLKLVRKPEYMASQIFNDNLVAVQLRKREIFLNKPIYTGFSVLDLSKWLMYDFHYLKWDKMRKENNVRLLFSDTDSFCYEIEGHDVYKQLAEYKEHFDFSNYPTTHELYSVDNKKKMGLMKDETASEPFEEVVGIRAKMYSILCNHESKKRAKGVSKAVIKKQLTHQIYRTTLFNHTKRRNVMRRILSKDHMIHTIATNKISLSAFDNKRYILDDGISSLAYGHKRINSHADH